MESIVNGKVFSSRERVLSLWQAAVLPQGHKVTSVDASASRFTAPVEYVLREEAAALLDWLLSKDDPIQARSSLREICRLKAVQTLNPSEALSFIFDLKSIIRLILGEAELTDSHHSELSNLDKRIDQLMLLAFDEYSECREHIMNIRLDEVRRLTQKPVR